MDLLPTYESHHTYGKSNSQLVCKLRMSINRLKQVARQWYFKLSLFLIKIRFIQSKSDYSLFTKGQGADCIAIVVYVDGIIIVGPNYSLIMCLKQTLDKAFKLKDMGDLKFFLGLEASCSDQGIILTER